MAKAPDIGSKRLISLAPSAWARWLTDDATIDAVEIVSGEFQWISPVSYTHLDVYKGQALSHGKGACASSRASRASRARRPAVEA